MNNNKKTLVLGASPQAWRFSNKAAHRLQEHKHDVVLLGRQKTIVAGMEIQTTIVELEDIDTVTMYLNPANQKEYYDYLINLQPKRIVFNPGSENPELAALARQNGIEVVKACTLVMLANGLY